MLNGECLLTKFPSHQRQKLWAFVNASYICTRPKFVLVFAPSSKFSIDSSQTVKLFLCSDGIYILNIYVCDGKRNCLNNEDENNCYDSCYSSNVKLFKACECGHSYSQCRSGYCVPISSVCDMVAQCDDISDEINCTRIDIGTKEGLDDSYFPLIMRQIRDVLKEFSLLSNT